MKSIFAVIFCAILLLNVSCKTPPAEETLPVFDLEVGVQKQVPDTFTWNSVAKKVTYIPISTSDDALFANIRLLHIDKEYYYMADNKTQTVFRTDKNGKVINHFCHVGQGPGEYGSLGYVYVEPENSLIKVFDNRLRKCIFYDLTGNFIREISLKEKGIDVPIFVADDFAVVRGHAGGDKKIYVADKELNIRKGFFPLDTTGTEMERLCQIWQISRCRNRDATFIHFANEDTLFRVTKDDVQPLCLLKKGAYKLPDDQAKKPMEITPQGSPYFQSMWIASIPGYYLITYMRESTLSTEVWDKATCQVLSRVSPQAGKSGFSFRFPSGKKMDVNMNSLFIHGNTLATFIPASTAAEEKIADVGEDDNPVLMVMEL